MAKVGFKAELYMSYARTTESKATPWIAALWLGY